MQVPGVCKTGNKAARVKSRYEIGAASAEYADTFAAIRSLSQSLPQEQLPHFLGCLEEVRAQALIRLVSSPNDRTAAHDELLDVREAARRLHVSEDYIYRNSSKYPFVIRQGRKLLFSAHGLDEFILQQRKIRK
jgi:hypothetical protein